MKKLILLIILGFTGACTERDMELIGAFAAGASAASGGSTTQNINAPMRAGTAFLKNQYTQGFNKVCVYDRVGSVDTLVISSTAICPLTI